MHQRTCDRSDCGRPHRARGLCTMHWKQQYGKPTTYSIICLGCGEPHGSTRPGGKFCSELCRDYVRCGPRSCPWSPPSTELVLWRRPRRTASTVQPARLWVSGSCAWCGDAFTIQVDCGVARHCSRRCARKAMKVARRARERGATGTYTWAEVTRKWIAIGRCCSYCHEPTALDLIEPDHVVPLSRGGSNSITNVVPACSQCNREKGVLLLHEWAARRAALGRTPRALHKHLERTTVAA